MEWTVATFLLANFILILGSILQMATGFFMMPGFIIPAMLAIKTGMNKRLQVIKESLLTKHHGMKC